MLKKLGTAFLWLIAIFMLSSVTIFNPGQVTDFFVKLFNIQPSIPEIQPVVVTERDQEIKQISEAITEADVRNTMSSLTTHASRVPGYSGHRAAFDFVQSEFKRLGIVAEVEQHDVTVPIDRGASITVDGGGEIIEVFGLWPNHVQTPTVPAGGIQGPVVYGGKGSFKELSGKPMQGSIVLLDFDCGQDYFNPRMLGAAAVVFFDKPSRRIDILGMHSTKLKHRKRLT